MQDLSLPTMDSWFKIMMVGIVWISLLMLVFLYDKREREKRKKEEENDNIEKAANAIHKEAKEKLHKKTFYHVEKIYQDYFKDEDNVKKQIESKINKIINDDLGNLVTEKVRSKINGCINKTFLTGSTKKLLDEQIEENLEKISDGIVDEIFSKNLQNIQEKITETIKNKLSSSIQKRTIKKIFDHIDQTIEKKIEENHNKLTFNILGEFDTIIDSKFLQKYTEKNDHNLTVNNNNEIKLTEKENTVIKIRFGLDGNKKQTLEEIGINLGCTRERIRQHQKNAIQKLVNIYKNKLQNNLNNNQFEQLTEIEKEIIKMRSGLDGKKIMSLIYVENVIDCTSEQIKQHQKNAIQKLMNIYKSNNPPNNKG